MGQGRWEWNVQAGKKQPVRQGAQQAHTHRQNCRGGGRGNGGVVRIPTSQPGIPNWHSITQPTSNKAHCNCKGVGEAHAGKIHQARQYGGCTGGAGGVGSPNSSAARHRKEGGKGEKQEVTTMGSRTVRDREGASNLYVGMYNTTTSWEGTNHVTGIVVGNPSCPSRTTEHTTRR